MQCLIAVSGQLGAAQKGRAFVSYIHRVFNTYSWGMALMKAKMIRLWVICQEDIYHPQNSDIYHPQVRTFPTPKKKHLPGGQLPPPIFFFFFWRTFLGFFDLQLMEDIKDGKEEVLDEVVMEHIK